MEEWLLRAATGEFRHTHGVARFRQAVDQAELKNLASLTGRGRRRRVDALGRQASDRTRPNRR